MPIQPLRDIHLAQYTTFQLGGRAQYFFEATTEDEIVDAVEWTKDARVALYVLGGGSNLVVADSGILGLALRIATRGIVVEAGDDSTTLRANAGVPWDDLVQFAVERNLGGIECLSGIPGLVGATPIQNVGAYGQEVSETLARVGVYDRVEQRRLTLSRDECEFGYRDSRFKSRDPQRFIVLNVEFELRHLPPAPPRHSELATRLAHANVNQPTVQDIRSAVIQLRREKGMLVESADPDRLRRSAGSFFLNPIVDTELARSINEREDPAMPIYALPDGRSKLSAAWLIEHSGHARGERDGNVGLSPQHCLALVAHERAKAEELVAFAHRIRDSVRKRFGIELQPEPSFWGFDALDAGLPGLEERAPPTLGSAPWPIER